VISRGQYSAGLAVDPAAGSRYHHANAHVSLISYHDPTRT